MAKKDNIIAAQKSRAILEYTLRRRSCPLHTLNLPGPDEEEIRTILSAATRVPDHGKLCPWHFIIFDGESRREVGKYLSECWKKEDPAATIAKLDLEAERFMRAPLVIGVVSRIREGKSPLWEQILSVGAACQNLCMAANALGYGTNWLTEWYAYNPDFKKKLGLDDNDHIAGFIYIGTPDRMPEERDRPNIYDIASWFEAGKPLNKGDNHYGKTGKGYPEAGFTFAHILPEGKKESGQGSSTGGGSETEELTEFQKELLNMRKQTENELRMAGPSKERQAKQPKPQDMQHAETTLSTSKDSAGDELTDFQREMLEMRKATDAQLQNKKDGK